jgi:Allene oxide cyclase barrel like domain
MRLRRSGGRARSGLGLAALPMAICLGVAMLAGCSSSTSTSAAKDSSVGNIATAGKAGCITLHFYENTSKYYVGNNATGVGAVGSYHDVLWADKKLTKRIGAGMGTFAVVSTDPSTQDLVEYSTEQDVFPDGSFVVSDYFDRTKMLGGQWVGGTNGTGMYVTGTVGRYLGMTGKALWRILSLGTPGVPTELKYTLCGKTHPHP